MKRTYEPREITNYVMKLLDELGEMNNAVHSLLNYLSEDDVYDWAISNGYLEPDVFQDDDWDKDVMDEEALKEVDIALKEVDIALANIEKWKTEGKLFSKW